MIDDHKESFVKAIVVDDEQLSIQMMERMINWNDLGIEIVATAKDGIEALEKFRQHSPGIVITDIKMPGMDGLQFIRKAREICRDTDIILISGYADFSYVKQAMDLGCVNYILKPVDEVELELALKKIMAKYEDKAEPVSNFLPLVQDAINYMNDNYDHDISLDDICRHLSISRNYFSFLFKRETGSTIWDHLTGIRMTKAKELLRDTRLTGREISYLIGYDNPSYFSKQFKKIVGQTPNGFRQGERRARR